MSKIDLAITACPSHSASSAVTRTTKIWLCLALIAADALALLAGFAIGVEAGRPGPISQDAWTSFAGVILIHSVISFQNQAYTPKCLTRATLSCRQSLLSLAATTLIFLLAAFSLKITGSLPRLALTIGIVSSAILILVARLMLCRYVKQAFDNRLYPKLVIVDGGAAPANSAGDDMIDAATASLRPDLDDPYMMSRLGSIFQDYHRVVISCSPSRKAEWAQLLKGANILGEIVVPELDRLGPLAVHNLDGATTMVVSRGPLDLPSRAKKRALDIALTLPILLALLPLMIVVALAIRLESAGPIFFRQERMGRGNRIFRIYKFRSMRVESCDADGGRSTSRDDDRITRVGRFIRKTSIDELPQLLNVLFGEMSLVGPRPHALGSTAGDELFWRVDRQYWHRHALKPGITGLAQVRGFRGATEERKDILDRLKADLEYLENWSLLRDIAILVRTARVLVHRNAY